MTDWRDLKSYYHAAPRAFCCVCGVVSEPLGVEPRFGYTVCEGCSDHAPVWIGEHRIEENDL